MCQKSGEGNAEMVAVSGDLSVAFLPRILANGADMISSKLWASNIFPWFTRQAELRPLAPCRQLTADPSRGFLTLTLDLQNQPECNLSTLQCSPSAPPCNPDKATGSSQSSKRSDDIRRELLGVPSKIGRGPGGSNWCTGKKEESTFPATNPQN